MLNSESTAIYKKDVLRVILDEPRLFLEESLGSTLIRGEVIVNFPKDTPIQGPIELVFEGTQRFHTWPEIMRGRSLGNPIETKLQVIELSLLPPNSKGIMPAGIQRFPFEFPIPASLPASTFIRDRIEIFYQVIATIRRSARLDHSGHTNPLNWIEKVRNTGLKKKYTHSASLRIVRPIQSFINEGASEQDTTAVPSPLPTPSNEPGSQDDSQQTPSSDTSSSNDNRASTGSQMSLAWNRRDLSEYQGFDEQYNQFTFSLAGRTISNFNQPAEKLRSVHGIRYKMSVDRTALVLGTSIGVELMIEPTVRKVKLKSILLKISENRLYTMKIPADHSWDSRLPETRKYNEGVKMILKWAYNFEAEDEELGMKNVANVDTCVGCKFVHQRSEDSTKVAYFDPPSPGDPSTKLFLTNGASSKSSSTKPCRIKEVENYNTNSSGQKKLVNLKEIDQPIKPGEYFGGRFVMPMPDCDSILHPSMTYDSVKISHWLQLSVTLECDNETFNIDLDSPMQMLDCRLVAADDENQTILPPPPTYQEQEANSLQQNFYTASTFWEQREPITSVSGWGDCQPCPCEIRKMQKGKNKQDKSKRTSGSMSLMSSSSQAKLPKDDNDADSYSSRFLPEWGPPPCYSD
ncbi:hypothetical protein BCV72DRAFT_279089 [Rhizopus microsporus var. microsporus]|uniref:Arrestin C-terminal-like domain-containing protein n=1 Tax=Rhizopus microsporus var. microsporus TaxID=86635 RepID=A0A1X0QUT3_RHIZD|nr:hypothetical protein BCV72DRAFT_279089 [Rhizopus microsporus var. microsporus]